MSDEQPASGEQYAEVSLRLQMLDAQVLDADDLPVGRVDDIELELSDGGLQVAALLIGQRHLGPRVGGITGSLMTHTARRLAGTDATARIEAHQVGSWQGLPKLRHRLAELHVARLETWLAEHVVRKIPGAGDAGL